MKKKISLVFISIIVITIILGITLNNSKDSKHTLKKDGVLYAMTLDGDSITSFPSKGLYRVDVECENATCTWLYDEWKLAIENITGDVSCDIDFVTITKTYLNNYVTSLAGTTQGTGQVVSENGYRYEGKNPNNYIWFNNELWRIIGVFDSNSHGQSNKNLVKIIRNNPIGGLAWDNKETDGVNDWSTSTLKNLLNGAYYNAQDGTSGDYCYGFYTMVRSNCDYRKIGIQTGFRGMIQNVTWYLGGHSSESATAASLYGYERGITVYSGNATSTTGYIGLMYPSDYGYSVLSSSCARTTNLSDYFTSSCAGQSWLYGSEIEWTITPDSSDSYHVFEIHYGGNAFCHRAELGWAVRPTLYLRDSVYVIDGDGSILDPYIISM